jgi:dienelactone hydrolase
MTTLPCFALLLALGALAVPSGQRTSISDEANVPAYTLPDPLLCQDGSAVTTAKQWRTRRRPELLRLFESEEYGKTRVGRPAHMRFVVREEKRDARGGKATRLRVGILFEGTEEGRQMELLLYLPNQVKGRVPVFLGLNFDGNYTVTDEPDIPLPKHWVNGLSPNRVTHNQPTESSRGTLQALWQIDAALARGYGVATVGYGEVEADAPGHETEGPRGLGPSPGPGDWGSIGAWAWALSRAMDYLATSPRVDAKRVAVIGFSRLGKAAMWAGAQDERFALMISNESGAGGVALHKRLFGETVADLNRNFPHWFSPNFRRYGGNEAALPIDQHELVALCAPRPVLIISATEDLWSDPKGEFLSGVAATPVYKLLGVEGMAVSEWPQAQHLVNSRIGYYLRPGKHDVTAEDWKAMLTFADAHLKR